MQPFLSQQQYLVVRGLLECDGKCLLVRDNVAKSFLEYFVFPGDFVQFGQDPVEALAEVFHRQTGLTVTIESPFHTYNRITPDINVQVIEIYYRVRLGDDISRKSSSDQVQWLPLSDSSYYLSQHIEEIIQLYREYYG
jgi:ADP-ribose pyrophosphatase YjhB (NUDIX family)